MTYLYLLSSVVYSARRAVLLSYAAFRLSKDKDKDWIPIFMLYDCSNRPVSQLAGHHYLTVHHFSIHILMIGQPVG
jgi:hypothetical protein